MRPNQTFRKIGRKLRHETSDIVKTTLPEHFRILLEQLARADTPDRLAEDTGSTGKR